MRIIKVGKGKIAVPHRAVVHGEDIWGWMDNITTPGQGWGWVASATHENIRMLERAGIEIAYDDADLSAHLKRKL